MVVWRPRGGSKSSGLRGQERGQLRFFLVRIDFMGACGGSIAASRLRAGPGKQVVATQPTGRVQGCSGGAGDGRVDMGMGWG